MNSKYLGKMKQRIRTLFRKKMYREAFAMCRLHDNAVLDMWRDVRAAR